MEMMDGKSVSMKLNLLLHAHSSTELPLTDGNTSDTESALLSNSRTRYFQIQERHLEITQQCLRDNAYATTIRRVTASYYNV
jgi:hypothetical protein